MHAASCGIPPGLFFLRQPCAMCRATSPKCSRHTENQSRLDMLVGRHDQRVNITLALEHGKSSPKGCQFMPVSFTLVGQMQMYSKSELWHSTCSCQLRFGVISDSQLKKFAIISLRAEFGFSRGGKPLGG